MPVAAPRLAEKMAIAVGALALLLTVSPSWGSTGSWLSKYELSVGAAGWTDGRASGDSGNTRYVRNAFHISNLHAYGVRARMRAGAFVEVGRGGSGANPVYEAEGADVSLGFGPRGSALLLEGGVRRRELHKDEGFRQTFAYAGIGLYGGNGVYLLPVPFARVDGYYAHVWRAYSRWASPSAALISLDIWHDVGPDTEVLFQLETAPAPMEDDDLETRGSFGTSFTLGLRWSF